MHRILDRITAPGDLHALGPRDRLVLAEELRAQICTTVSKNGGHFGSNMGVVELTIALHTVFDSPRDRIVWDVSHQCYAHKLLTGRQAEFHTLRQYEGISGFCHKGESEHDTAFAGHAGTATSIALGLAQGHALVGAAQRVVSVVGDASVATGMTLEALNHAGWLETPLLVILNDNGMSIAPPVGGLHRTLDHDRRAAPEVVPGQARPFFESLGLRYAGPIDGHDAEALIEALARLKDLPGPTLLHVHTKKGQGWPAAVEDPVAWHAAKGFFPPPTKAPGPKARMWTQAFADALMDLGEGDERVVAITAAMPGGTGLDAFARAFPARCFDVGICEQHGAGFASGLRLAGLRPVFTVYSTFLQRAYDQVIHDVAIQGNPMVLAMDRGGLVGDDGVTHQGLFDISYLRCIPETVLLAPHDEAELRLMLRWAVESERLCGVRWPRAEVALRLTEDEPPPIELGRGWLVRGGRGAVAFFAYGAMVEHALAAADLLDAEGAPTSVADARFAKPIDVDLLVELCEAHERVITVEDHTVVGGFGSACLEALALRRPDLLPRLVLAGVPDAFVHHGARALQLRDARLDPEGLAARAREALEAAGIPSAIALTSEARSLA